MGDYVTDIELASIDHDGFVVLVKARFKMGDHPNGTHVVMVREHTGPGHGRRFRDAVHSGPPGRIGEGVSFADQQRSAQEWLAAHAPAIVAAER